MRRKKKRVIDYPAERLQVGQVYSVSIRNVNFPKAVYGIIPSYEGHKPQYAFMVQENGKVACYRCLDFSIRGSQRLTPEVIIPQAAAIDFRRFKKQTAKSLETQIKNILISNRAWQ